MLCERIYGVISGHASGLKPGDPWWLAWHVDTLVLSSVLFAALVYLMGVRNLWKQAGLGTAISVSRGISFIFGLATITVALMSPLDTLGNDLAWVHMVQHMVLMVVAAPLVMFGRPGLAMTWCPSKQYRRRLLLFGFASDRGWINRLIRWLWNPIFIWILHAGGLWLWHLPVLYEKALVDPLVHDIEHLTFFIVACLFWRVVIDGRQNRVISPGLGVFYIFTTSIHAMFLGVFMALSPKVWYPIYNGRTRLWGLDALEDQQIAGAIMWMPACTIYAIAAVLLFVTWLERIADDDKSSCPPS